MSLIQHPERLDKAIDFIHISRKKTVKPSTTKRKQYWEKEEKPLGLSVPILPSLPVVASAGDLVYSDGLYIFINGSWQRIDQSVTQMGRGGAGGSGSIAFVLSPEPEAVYATKTGGGDVYVALTTSGRMRRLVFEAQTTPASDASATFAMNAGRNANVRYSLSLIVVSNQSNKTLSFRVYTDNTYDVVVTTDSGGFGSQAVEIGGSDTITVTRRYTQESGLVYPCWTACGFVIANR
jgi:hypothetical protein